MLLLGFLRFSLYNIELHMDKMKLTPVAQWWQQSYKFY